MSSPSNVPLSQTSSKLKMSTSSMVNIVKDICRTLGWEVFGSHYTREGKEECGVVHFYKLKVKGGLTELMTGGVGVSMVEAVKRAFKTMQNRLIGEKWEKMDNVYFKKQDDICDNFVKFPDEESMNQRDDPFLTNVMTPSAKSARPTPTRRFKKTTNTPYTHVPMHK